jgi:site-specific DNA recombinase
MNLVGYIRCSTKLQDSSYTLEEQDKSIQSYCNLYKHNLIGVNKDIGSGSKINSGLKELLDLVYSNKDINGIIVDKLDRLFRNTEELLKTIRELKSQCKVFISVKEQLDISTPAGFLMLSVLGSLSEFEKSRISERVILGKKSKKEVGGFVGGTVPFGYQSVTKTFLDGKTIKELVKDSNEQNVITKIKNHRRAGKTWTEIANYLNASGFKTKRGKQFTATHIYNVFNNKLILLNDSKV